MSAMYYDLQDHNTLPEFQDEISEYVNISHHRNIRFKALQDSVKKTYTDDLDLIAIAYFSWEPSNRQFLVRRVFPTYYDFITYSSCPETWGVLGKIIKELEKGKKIPKEFHYINEFGQPGLPFLSEVFRIGFRSILGFPVIHPTDDPSLENLKGAMLLFLKNRTIPNLDQYEKEILNYKYDLNKELCHFLDIQKDLIENGKDLFDIWSDEQMLTKMGINPNNLKILRIKIAGSVQGARLHSVASKIIATLSNFEYYSLKKKHKDFENDREVVLLVAPNSPSKYSKADILKEVGSAIQQQDKMKIDIEYLYPKSTIREI